MWNTQSLPGLTHVKVHAAAKTTCVSQYQDASGPVVQQADPLNQDRRPTLRKRFLAVLGVLQQDGM